MRKLQRRAAKGFSGLEMLEQRELLTAVVANTVDPLFLQADLALWRPSTVSVMVSSNRNAAANLTWGYGIPTDQMVSGDLNGDGLTDTAAFRNGAWYIDTNRDGGVEEVVNFGQAGDKAVIGDVDGDGLGDLLIFRNGAWFTEANLGNGSFGAATSLPGFGIAGDMPVVGDFRGDGRLDRAVYRPSTGQWFFDYGMTGAVSKIITFGGVAGDQPFVADMDNDGISDIGIFRSGTFYVDTTRTGVATNTYTFGQAGDQVLAGTFDPSQLVHTLKPSFAVWRPAAATVYSDNTWSGSFATHGFGVANGVDQMVTGDFNGDTVTDTAIFRNGTWYIDTGFNGAVSQSLGFGLAGDVALSGDVNNDGYSDLIVYRSGTWYVSDSHAGAFTGAVDSSSTFGVAGDIPVVGDFNGDGTLDRAVYRPSTGQWLIDYGFQGTVQQTVTFGGQAGDVPVAFDFNGDRKTDLGIYRAGTWLVDETLQNNAVSFTHHFGQAGDVPMPGYFNTASSVFVRSGGTGTGTEASPFGSVAAAVAAAPDGSFIRIGPGTYTDFPNFASRNNLTFWGANRFATILGAPVGSGLQMASSKNIYLFDLTFASTDTAAGAGRGLVVVQSTVFGFGLRTNGTREEGVYIAGATTGAMAWFRDSNFDSTISGSGIYVEENAVLVVENSTASGNATGAKAQTAQYGRGIIVSGATNIATIRGVTMDHNTDHGLVVDGTVDLLLVGSDMSFNANVNGAIFDHAVTFKIDRSTFNSNGTNSARGSTGFNGLEIELDAGFGGSITNSQFNNNSAYGLFLGSGATILVQSNIFRDDFCAIYLQGDNNASATIVGNKFNNSAVTSGTANAVGIAAGGPAVATIGSAALPNIFNNLPAGQAIYFPTGDAKGAPQFTIPSNSNVFINSPSGINGTPVGGGATVTGLAPVLGNAQSFFDESYYLTNNPDVAAAVLSGALASGWAHFQAYGQFEGRSPSALYNDAYYLAHNLDVAAAVNSHALPSGFFHFVNYGFGEFREGAAPVPVAGDAYSFFDEVFYRATNPDVEAGILAGTIVSGWAHFEAYGQFEGRQPSRLYKEPDYLARYADVRSAVMSHAIPDGFVHWVSYGFPEGRIGT